MKPILIASIAVGSVALLGGGLYFLLRKPSDDYDKNYEGDLQDEPDGSDTNSVPDVVACDNLLMNNGECSEADYSKFLLKKYKFATSRALRYQYLLAGTGLSNDRMAALSGQAVPSWVTVQAQDKFKKGVRNVLENAIIDIMLWHENQTNYNISANQLKVAKKRLVMVDGRM